MKNIYKRLEDMKIRFKDSSFIENKGLANEVGIYVFAYNPSDEILVDYFFTDQAKRSQENVNGENRIILFDLYEIFIEICKDKRILDQIPKMEEKRGKDFIQEQLLRIAKPELFIKKMEDSEIDDGDIIVIKGVGKVYPFMRSHKILNNIQHIFENNPIVMLYPGEYNGQRLDLFGKFKDDNYYRAFNII